ncbi:hypothetical protein Taro_021501 [Colocasia esculenta]|uniref:Ubiquitin-like protease family profile domain-containing protein n=1 Tax=Colocasia esculenta TaxID=4460 RepID=A0A843V8C9_COLES|nr:hypothetical protein [Colocasia esculenta]
MEAAEDLLQLGAVPVLRGRGRHVAEDARKQEVEPAGGEIKHSLDIPIVKQHLFNVGIHGKTILQYVLLHVYTQPLGNLAMNGRQIRVPPYEKNEEAASDIPIIIVPTCFSWDEDKTTTRVLYGMPDDFRHHKATKVNVSTSEPIFVDSQESTDTLPRGKKEERRDYVTREALGVAEKCIISEYVLQYMSTMFTVYVYHVYSICLSCLQYIEFMFNGSEEGHDNFLSFHDIRELLFARESESVVIDCYVNAYLFRPHEENPDIFWNFGYLGAVLKGYVQSCRDDKSKKEHFEYAFRKLDRALNEFDLIFSPMHVEELKRYLKGKHIDADKWPLRYPDPCPQQGSGDDCGFFTCKYMECLERRDIQNLLFN